MLSYFLPLSDISGYHFFGANLCLPVSYTHLVSDDEVEAVVEYIKGDHKADYDDDVMVEIERQAAVEKKQKTGLAEDGPDEDPMLTDAIKVVVESGQASTSLLQRKLKLGYARAEMCIRDRNN